jgi:hypothetical protein
MAPVLFLCRKFASFTTKNEIASSWRQTLMNLIWKRKVLSYLKELSSVTVAVVNSNLSAEYSNI